MVDVPVYEGWWRVPSGLFSKTQLADLDLPRLPDGPVRAYADVANWRGKKEFVELYALHESVPSPATANQLQAARGRVLGSDYVDRRVCEQCGARPDRPVPELGHVSGSDHLPAGEASGTRHLCLACARVVRLRAAVATAAWIRADATQWAAEVLAAEPCVVRVEEVLRPAAPSGRQNPDPVALRVDAVDAVGRRLVRATIRLAGPRVKAVPDGAVTPNSVEEQVRSLLAAPVVVTWRDSELTPLLRLYHGREVYAGANRNSLRQRAGYWRGEVDPDHLTVRSAIDPTTADRTLLLLRRMAAEAQS